MRQSVLTFIHKLTISTTIFALALVSPMTAFRAVAADEAAVNTVASEQPAVSDPVVTTAAVETPPATIPAPDPAPVQGPNVDPGPSKPTGADGATYQQNSDGSWENEHFIWDPATHQTRPKVLPDYSYDPATGTWSTNDWAFNAASGRYEPAARTISSTLAAQLGLLPGGQQASIANTGPNSNNSISSHDTANGLFDLYTTKELNNYFNMNSLSGNASVDGNTLGGDALTGDATVMANILNLLQSAWSISGGQLMTFIKSFFGDVHGDILLDTGANKPSGQATTLGGNNSSIAGTGPNSNNSIDSVKDGDVTINTSDLNTIENNLTLAAQSGDADVTGNTSGGSARSGDANVLLNLVNLIGSSIHSGQSFFGILNIFGDFDGDILLPDNFLQSVLASGNSQPGGSTSTIDRTGPNSNNTISESNDGSLLADTSNIDTINNNINANASSGNASTDGNTKAGSATTGDVLNTIGILNLTGHKVVAENALLVFVNVYGKWLGLIMDAPQGSNSALVGGGVSSNSSSPIIGNHTLNSTTENTITNNLDLSARSGDASVSGNTEGGDATSGAARIGGGIANIIDSNFSLSNWFGVLFINVFGNWTGSFGRDTAAGESQANAAVAGESSKSTEANTPSVINAYSVINTLTTQAGQESTQQTNITGNSEDSPVAPLAAIKQSGPVTWQNYIWPIAAALALLVASVLYKFGREEQSK